MDDRDLPPTPLPAELGIQRNSRAELGGDVPSGAAEIDSKTAWSQASELPAYKN